MPPAGSSGGSPSARSRSSASPPIRRTSPRNRAAADTPASAASTKGERRNAPIREGTAQRRAGGHHLSRSREVAARSGGGGEGSGERVGPGSRGRTRDHRARWRPQGGAPGRNAGHRGGARSE